MAGDGKVIKVTNGGYIEFDEKTTTGRNSGRLQTTDLTGNYVWTLPNKSCNLGGLGPGEYYGVSQGGTGLGSIPANRIPYGSGGDHLNLTPAPDTANTFIGYDGFGLRFAPISIGPNGEVNTLKSTGLGAQINRSKLGSEIQIRSLTGGNAIQIVQNQDDIVFNLNFDAFTGIVKVPQGGTGLGTVNAGDFLVGAANNTYTTLAKPANPNMVLRSNPTTGAYEWVDRYKLLTGVQDHISGQFDPTLTSNALTTYMPYRFKMKSLIHGMGAGTASYNLKVNGTSIKAGTVDTSNGKTTVDLAQSGAYPTYEIGGYIDLVFSNLNLAQTYYFTIVIERVAVGD